MDHKTFVASLPPEVKARLQARSDRAGLWHLAGHFGAILLVGTLIALAVPGWGLLLPVQGVLIVSAFNVRRVRRTTLAAA